MMRWPIARQPYLQETTLPGVFAVGDVRVGSVKRVEAVKIALTLHGASGTDDGDLKAAIAAGVNIIHINTELRLVWRRGIETALREHPDEVGPYRLLPAAYDNTLGICCERLELFNGKAVERII